MKSKYIQLLPGLLLLWIFVVACEDDKYEVPTLKHEFQNDCIKRTLGPNVVSASIRPGKYCIGTSGCIDTRSRWNLS
jgi:hypothetical protein